MSSSLFEEWIAKAEDDYGTALDLRKLKNPHRADAICFHCQQSAEKYLKGFLVRAQVDFTRTHDLNDLCKRCTEIDETFELIRLPLDLLQPFSVAIRYPGTSATNEDVVEAIKAIKQVREFVRARLGLKK